MKTFSLLILCLFLAVPAFAEEESEALVIEINRSSERRFPLAIPQFIDKNGKPAGGVGEKMTTLIKKDFELSGLFDVWDESRFPTTDIDMKRIDFKMWRSIESHALIKGELTKADGKRVIQLRLYDVADGKMLLGKQYQYTSKTYPDAIHRFVDGAMKVLTGKRGPFESQIAASCGSGLKRDIFSFEMDDERRGRLTTSRADNVSPTWSPSGQLAYTSRLKNQETHIFVGTGKGRQVTKDGSVNIMPSFTPEGNIVWSSNRGTGDMELYQMTPSGKMLNRVTSSYNIDAAPAVSPRGNAVVFASERAGKLHLFKKALNGKGASRMTYVGRYNDQPDWSPDGKEIVFASQQGGFDIYLMESDGSNIVRLTRGEGSNESPSFSPDGRYIVFTSSRGGIFIMKKDGTDQRVLPKTHGCVNPDWGPWLSE